MCDEDCKIQKFVNHNYTPFIRPESWRDDLLENILLVLPPDEKSLLWSNLFTARCTEQRLIFNALHSLGDDFLEQFAQRQAVRCAQALAPQFGVPVYPTYRIPGVDPPAYGANGFVGGLFAPHGFEAAVRPPPPTAGASTGLRRQVLLQAPAASTRRRSARLQQVRRLQ